MVIPVQSVSESFLRPTSMLYRNFLAMEVEECIRAHPVDGAILLGGCDKTVPGLTMGAASAGVPALFVPAGAMMSGRWRDRILGTGSSTWAAEAEWRAGRMSDADWFDLSQASARSPGTCNTMGTASTMALLVDVMGLSLPGASTIPALDSAHSRMASASGRQIVDMVWADRTPDKIVTNASFENALVVDMAIAGSTNSLIHLIAMAKRLGLRLGLDDFRRCAARVPVLVNLMPAGTYLMEDLHFAGGSRALFNRLSDLLQLSAQTCTGRTLGEEIDGCAVHDEEVIRPLANPVYGPGALTILAGTLAPNGAVLKKSGASAALLKHIGPAVVFSNHKDMMQRIDDPSLEVTPDSVLVLRNGGPKGAPGMPEWGMMPIPKRLLEMGVEDMVRISDARMSGTSYGTCILHVAPEAAVGGPLALVEDGDLIELDAEAGVLNLLVAENVLAQRREHWTQPQPHYARGYGALFLNHITQADEGCDFDFLMSGGATAEPEI